jgi:hypothetical protein
LIDNCIRQLKLGKASGPDDLSTEHLSNAHPALVMHLCFLFCGIALHGFVPDNFGCGTVIPLIKDKLGDVNDLNNYRGITLIPVISKLFELTLLHICAPYMITDDLQFGFKKNVGCADAIFLLSETVDYFRCRGSTVYSAALDFKKAFDRINHYKLFSSLLRACFPVWVITILINWYSKLYVAVRWNSALSSSFSVQSGVRQGSSFSPALFNVFINIFIAEIKSSNYDCKINLNFVGVIMYADDLLLLSATVDGLQRMLDCCEAVSSRLELDFNCNKCSCAVIGPASRYTISDMKLGCDDICWSNTFKYLGIHFVTGKKLAVDINFIKRKFFAASNCILGNVKCLNDLIKLSLMESFCLPILLYATVSFKLSIDQINELNIGWNSIFRRIFGFHKWESVRCFINGIGRLDFIHLRMYLQLKFVKKCLLSVNSTLANVMVIHLGTTEFCNLCSKIRLARIDYDNLCRVSFGKLKACVHNAFATP